MNSTPFSWQDKRTLRRIRERCEEASSALVVYLGLTVVASDTQRETFATTHAWIAGITGLSERTVWERIKDLSAAGVISVTTPTLKAPSTYRLLAFSNDCGTLSNGCRTFRSGMTPLPPAPLRTSEESSSRESTRPSAERPGQAEIMLYAEKIGLAPWKAEDFWNEMEAAGWLDYQHRPVVSWQAMLRRVKVKWEADGRPTGPKSCNGPCQPPRRAKTDAELIREAR